MELEFDLFNQVSNPRCTSSRESHLAALSIVYNCTGSGSCIGEARKIAWRGEKERGNWTVSNRGWRESEEQDVLQLF